MHVRGDASGLRLERLADDGVIPNNRLPLLFYGAAVSVSEASAERLEAMFAAAGWPPAWRYTVYPFHHYHSNTHEVLGIAAGSAQLLLGGPEGRAFDVAAGDVIVVPAGVGHCQVAKSDDFLVVGGYPAGSPAADLMRGRAGERPDADLRIGEVPIPPTDPVTGEDRPLSEHWG